MAFVVSKRPLAAAPITAVVYDENGDKLAIEFVAKYHRHKPEQITDLQDGMINLARVNQGLEPVKRRDGTDVPAYAFVSDVDFLKDKVAGWVGVRDGSGESLSFSDKSLAAILSDWPELILPLFRGFFSAHQQAQEKN